MTSSRPTLDREGANRIFYLTAPPAVREFGTWCVTVGTARAEPGRPYPPDERRHPHRYRPVSVEGRVLDELQLVFISEGKGEFHDQNGGIQAVREGACLVLLPGRWHRYHPDPLTGWTEYWVGVRGDTALRAVRLLGLDARGPVVRTPGRGDVLREALRSGFEHLLELAAIHDTVAHVRMTATVLDLLTLMARRRDDQPVAGGDGDPVDRAIGMMHSCIRGRIRLETIARECGLSESTFRRVFRDRTGSSPYRYYMALKVNEVKRRLAHSGHPLKAIAAELGFTDQYHLSRVFREYTGVSPSSWKRRGG